MLVSGASFRHAGESGREAGDSHSSPGSDGSTGMCLTSVIGPVQRSDFPIALIGQPDLLMNIIGQRRLVHGCDWWIGRGGVAKCSERAGMLQAVVSGGVVNMAFVIERS
ncbi:hypothetical protein E2C01_042111 [Portunus trituberculatus]|uniref:Uncharacterized protein n=1 Tax=Portunus trituberculatus TaxID=210409 RepID=A0A5B7FLN1_PORTR|nr:hypothetical protein [Portunus trituberculatus]